MKDFFKLVADFSIDKLTDPYYWANWLVFWLSVLFFGLLFLLPLVIKGGVTPLTSFSSQLAQGWYWASKGIFPDIVGAALHILRRSPEGKLEFDLDYLFQQKPLKEVAPNTYQAFTLRMSTKHSCKHSHIMRLNPYGPKERKRKWWHRYFNRNQKPCNPLKDYSRKKAKIIQRYHRLYKPLMASLGEFTNDTAALALFNVPMQRKLVLMCKTFGHRPGGEAYHRMHLFDADTLAHWPADPREPVSIIKPEYVDRYHLSAELAKQYRSYPWRFCVLVYFIKPEDAKLIVRPLPTLPGPYRGWLPAHARQLNQPLVLMGAGQS